MAKNKHFKHQPAPPPSTAVPEPTPEQLTQFGALTNLVTKLNATYGPVSADAVSEPVGATLAESLKRVEGLLGNARALFEKARSLESTNKDEAARLAGKESIVKKAADRVRADHEAVTKREAAASRKEASFVEQSASLAERELNAERGFLVEKTRVLKPIDDELKRLHEERDRLDAEIAGRHEKAEEELRVKAASRAAKDANERRQLDAEIDRERRKQFEALRTELASERRKAEEAWRTELERRTSLLDKKEADLDKRERAQRASAIDLQAEKELHNEDCAGLARKVERLVTEQTEHLRHEVASLKKQLESARGDRDAYWKDLDSRKELDRRFGDRTAEDILSALTAAEKDRDAYAQQVRELPDARAAERLAQLERERSAWLEERALLFADLAKAKGEIQKRRESGIELEGAIREKELLLTQNRLLQAAESELRTRVDELTRQEDHRNPMTALTSLDEKEELQAETRTTTPLGGRTPTLKEFAIDLRHRIAGGVEGRTLYYSDRDVRAFIGGLATTRLILLQGISGTGKSSLPKAFAAAVGGGYQDIAVQAGWRDRQDLIGYYNAFHRHYYASDFLQALYKAGTPGYRDRPFMMVLEEMNLSRPEHFFADFIDALEKPINERSLTLVTDPVSNAPRLMRDGRFLPIPPNVWFIGTANHDESTAEFADKTYDRAHVMEMPRKTEAAHFTVEPKGQRNPISYNELENAFDAAGKNQAAAVQKATSWLQKSPFTEDLQRRFRVGWGNRLEHQIARYLPVVVEADGTIGEAMDHLLVTKVLRKLKDRHDVRAAALEELSNKLLTAWENLDGANPPERCVALIDHEIAAKKGEELV